MAVNTTRFSLRGTQPRSSTSRRTSQQPSDDEILGIRTTVARPSPSAPDDPQESANASPAQSFQAANSVTDVQGAASTTQHDAQGTSAQAAVSPDLAQVLDAHPQLREAWDSAQQFRSVFATPAAAQDAKNQLDELDGMFFSAKPGDQAALAARIHDLSPSAFQGLTQAMQAHAAKVAARNSDAAPNVADSNSAGTPASSTDSSADSASSQAAPVSMPVASAAPASAVAEPVRTHAPATAAVNTPAPTDPHHAAQVAFFHSTNSAAVHQVLAAIETQVNHLLPSGVSAPTKTRIVGEIYRDLGSVLGANRQLGHQLREAFRSGAGDAAHQQAIVSLVTGRARQALPSIARRVINEWTHGVVAANQEKLSRHESAAKRVDISGAGSSDGVNRKPVSPRDV
ncbi:MAG TPA: hypothetical protein VKB26_00390, partial [Candidatus Acidoferrales bacterium]|nr:hypothetical protein [Candidatus Acidoferrales bacterium]